jgi:DNA transformation protein
LTPDALREVFSALGPVAVRSLFGGRGISLDGRTFAIELAGEIYLKTDERTAERFKAAGSTPFTFLRSGRTVVTSYWRAPADAVEDADAMKPWAELALSAARVRQRRTRNDAI